MCQKLFCLFWNTFFNYRDYIVNNSQTIDCLPTMFLRVRSVTILEDPGTVMSGPEKGRDESFEVRVKEPVGTDSHQGISKNSSGYRLLIGHKKCFVLLCPIGEQFLLNSFREFLHVLENFVPPFLPTRLTAPGCPRMFCDLNQQFSRY